MKTLSTKGVMALSILVQRISVIISSLKIEYAETVSILSALSWIIPLVFQPNFHTFTPAMAAFNERFPLPYFLVTATVLFLYQVIALLLGGRPSLFIRSDEQERYWLFLRGFGVWLSVIFWAVMAILLATGGMLLPASVWLGGVSILCAGGVWKFDYLIKENRALEQLREVEVSRQLTLKEG